MPLYHCTKCLHEWEDCNEKVSSCDWCGAEGYIMKEETEFERFIRYDMWPLIDKEKKKEEDKNE